MKRMLVFIVAFISGVSLTLEGSIGGALGQNIGELEASTYVFAVAFLILSPFVLTLRRTNLSTMLKLPKWELTGGLFGAAFLVLLFFSVAQLGIGIAMAAVIIGQFVISIIIDHNGWLGASRIRFNTNRFIAIVLLTISLFLIL
ncbi:DMT family transporter [Salicibibacter cibarius]|uniref:DMT family transporter n=1 Tax=Salicibibacter cibarius TaxID=2743000 RepID=A0A7T7CCB2_9BACI|nr:DMT family transporter [Salicibibacter cibarius]QQK76814.1 DMT family transporter [Salicibibacter cibarius]